MSNCQTKAGIQSYLALFDWDENVGVCQNVANLNVGSKNKQPTFGYCVWQFNQEGNWKCNIEYHRAKLLQLFSYLAMHLYGSNRCGGLECWSGVTTVRWPVLVF